MDMDERVRRGLERLRQVVASRDATRSRADLLREVRELRDENTRLQRQNDRMKLAIKETLARSLSAEKDRWQASPGPVAANEDRSD
jgi:predicted nuclease with TOPRIM domain